MPGGLTETNTLKRKDDGTDEQSKVVLVEELNVGARSLDSEIVDAVVPKVHDTKDNEEVGEHTGQRQDLHLADQNQGNQDNQRDKDINLLLNAVERAFCEGLDDGIDVFGNKDQVGTAESDLGEEDRDEDSNTGPFAKEDQTNVLEGLTDDQADLDKHQEGDAADGGDKGDRQTRKQDT